MHDVHRHRLVDPNECIRLGVEERLDELPDPSLAAASARVQSARVLLEHAAELDRQALSFDDGLDLELAENMLRQEVHDGTYLFNGRTTLQQLPTAGDDISEGLFAMFVNDPRPSGERLGNITARLEMVPDYLEALLRRLHCPVQRWVAIDQAQVAGLPELFRNIESWAETAAFPDLERLRRARGRAEESLTGYSHRLRALETSSNIHVGEATARRVVELRGIELSLEALHRIAREYLEANRDTVESLRGKLAEKYGLDSSSSVREVQTYLNASFAVDVGDGDLNAVLRRYDQEKDRVLEFLRARRLFPIPEDQAMKIVRTPAFLEPTIPAGAMMAPPPFRAGVRTSLVYLTLSEELLDEHTQLAIPGMMIHEGIPGHHLHLAAAAAHPSVIRRHIDAMEQAEGWTTMLEDYMLDVGYMGSLTDEARFVGKLDIARIGARVGIDLFFMTGDRGFLDLAVPGLEGAQPEEPFEAAGRLLQAVTGFTSGRVHAELNWYSTQRGYPLSYLAGNHLVWKLKADVQKKQGASLSGEALDRRFHEVFLGAGTMPLKYLRKVFVEKGLL